MYFVVAMRVTEMGGWPVEWVAYLVSYMVYQHEVAAQHLGRVWRSCIPGEELPFERPSDVMNYEDASADVADLIL